MNHEIDKLTSLLFIYSLASVRRVSHPELTAKAEGLHMEFRIAFVLNANPVQ